MVDVTRGADGQRHAATAAATSSSSASASVRQSSRQLPSRTIADDRRLAVRSGAASSSSTAQAKLGSSASGSAPPPTRATVSSTVAAGELGEPLGAGANGPAGSATSRDHPQHRDVAVERERSLERRERQLVGPQSPLERVAAEALDEVGAPDDDPRLRAAEELVAGEADEVGAGGERVARRSARRASGASTPEPRSSTSGSP